MTATITSAKAALVAQITAAAITDVTVLGYEPAAVPRGLTVTVATSHVLTDEYLFAVRLYVSDNNPQLAQASIDTLIPAVEAALSGTYGPVEWEVFLDAVDSGDVVLATASVTAPREDF